MMSATKGWFKEPPILSEDYLLLQQWSPDDLMVDWGKQIRYHTPLKIPPQNAIEVSLEIRHLEYVGEWVYGVYDERCFSFNSDCNEWLTEYAKHNWGIYTKVVMVSPCKLVQMRFMRVYLKPFIAFQSIDDALLFKLTF